MYERIRGHRSMLAPMVALVIAISLVGCSPATAQPTAPAKEEKKTNEIQVMGEGTATAPPDIAYISTGVQTAADTAQEAQQQNAKLMSAVVSRLERLGIDKKDLHTTSISLWPYEEPVKLPPTEPRERITKFRAENRLTITVRDISRVGQILDEAVAAGANIATSLQFSFKDETALRERALGEAIKNARARAEAIAKGLGVKIIGPISVTEEGVTRPGPMPLGKGGDLGGELASTPIEPGEVAVTARVRVTFSYL